MSNTRHATPPRLSPKRVLFYCILLSLSLVALEGTLRAYFAFRVGPTALFYGTGFDRRELRTPTDIAQQEEQSGTQSVQLHENVIGNYAKYFPHQLRYDHDEHGNLFTATINSSGFRGKEFNKEKNAGVIRVVTLGASSTFGFTDRDNETYPYYLEELLNEQCQDPFEVINLGIPHLMSHQIYALFMAEALPLHPDIVTFYEGINDATLIQPFGAHLGMPEKVRGRSRDLFRMARDHLISVALVNQLRTKTVTELSEQDFRALLEDPSKHFLTSLVRLQQACQQRDIFFIIASQQAKSFIVGREEIKGITYSQEADLVRAKLREGKKLTANELAFLIHSALMDAERNWVSTHRVPFVDVISALDQDRDALVSWVHLTPEGNRMIAAALAEEILHHTCHNRRPRSPGEPSKG